MGADQAMSVIRNTARHLLYLSGIAERRLRRKLGADGNRLILLFHRVLPEALGLDDSPEGMVVSREMFASLLDHLARRFDILDPDSFFEGYPAPLGRPSLLLTFDDGWLDLLTHAFPEMKARGIGGICFLSVRHVDEGAAFWPERLLSVWRALGTKRLGQMLPGEGPEGDGGEDVERLLHRWKRMDDGEREEKLARLEGESGEGAAHRRVLRWEDARCLQEGGVEMGSHGCGHRILTRIPPEDVRIEMVRSHERIAAMLGRPPRFFAYPNGESSGDVRALAGEAGYTHGFSITGDMGDPFCLPRVNMHEGKVRGRSGRWSEARLLHSLGRTR
jgi:peptidoglycan/xylan/chitin deacetylase (PgdA/CDA1 family)